MHTRVFFRRGKRVGLTILHEDDLPFLLTAMNNHAMTRFLKRRTPVQWQEERDYMTRVSQGSTTEFTFGIALIRTGELIGMMGLHRVNWINRTATTGAWIASDKHRSRGYGSEAKELLLGFAFNDIGLRKISSNVLSINPRSQRYNEKCGYKVEGIRKAHTLVDGVYVDDTLMAVFREDWERNQKATRRKKR